MEYVKRDKNWEKLAAQVYKIQKKRKTLQELEQELLDDLKKASEFISTESSKYRFQRINRKGLVDNKQIFEDFHVDIEAYRTEDTIVSWKLFKY